ncbi:MAG: peptidylprolyl isomerase [Bacteroidia bacterium]
MSLNRLAFLLLFLITGTWATAQKKDSVVFSVGGEPVTIKEFRYIYEKNNASDPNLYKTTNLRDYLNLYINFKLKVKEARDLGLDTTEKFVKEYTGYRNQLAQPYLTDRSVSQSLIDEGYVRMKEELRASHILIPVSMEASPKDSMEAYNKIMEAYNKAIKGDDFEALAREYSKDPSVANNGGDLGYFTAFQMIYPFESAAYNIKKVGDISKPVRTRFGYHVIKLTDRRPYRGEVQVRHILVNSNDNEPKEKKQIAKNKIDSLYSLLQKGAEFTALARQHSDHVQSKASGGELPNFNSFSQYPDEFKNAAFSLAKDGDFSKPFQTPFGWHIVQRVSVKPLQSQKEMDEYLKTRIARDTRSEKSKDAAIKQFKKSYGFKENKKSFKKFSKYVDTTLLKGNWVFSPVRSIKRTMFTLDGKNHTQEDFAKWLQKHQQANRFNDVKFALNQYYKEYVDETVYNYQDQQLETKYPEFSNVAKEYKEGILLFEITDQKVWGKAMQDTVGLKAFYDKNKEKYRWQERADVTVFDLRDKAAVAPFMQKLKTGKKPVEELTNEYIKKDPLSLNYKSLLVERKDNAIVDTLSLWKPGVFEVGEVDGRYYVVKINKIIKPDYKKLSEIKGVVIADYQEFLEKQWLADLRRKYKVEINEPLVNSLIKQ